MTYNQLLHADMCRPAGTRQNQQSHCYLCQSQRSSAELHPAASSCPAAAAAHAPDVVSRQQSISAFSTYSMLITWPGLAVEQATRKGETQDRSREVLVADFAWRVHWLPVQVDLLLLVPTAATEQLVVNWHSATRFEPNGADIIIISCCSAWARCVCIQGGARFDVVMSVKFERPHVLAAYLFC